VFLFHPQTPEEDYVAHLSPANPPTH